MRTSCTLFGPSSLVHTVAAALEKAGFDATTLQRDGNTHADQHEFPGTSMLTVVVLDRDGADIIESRSVSRGITTTETTIKVKGRRGRPPKATSPPPTKTVVYEPIQTAPVPPDEDLPF